MINTNFISHHISLPKCEQCHELKYISALIHVLSGSCREQRETIGELWESSRMIDGLNESCLKLDRCNKTCLDL